MLYDIALICTGTVRDKQRDGMKWKQLPRHLTGDLFVCQWQCLASDVLHSSEFFILSSESLMATILVHATSWELPGRKFGMLDVPPHYACSWIFLSSELPCRGHILCVLTFLLRDMLGMWRVAFNSTRNIYFRVDESLNGFPENLELTRNEKLLRNVNSIFYLCLFGSSSLASITGFAYNKSLNDNKRRRRGQRSSR